MFNYVKNYQRVTIIHHVSWLYHYDQCHMVGYSDLRTFGTGKFRSKWPLIYWWFIVNIQPYNYCYIIWVIMFRGIPASHWKASPGKIFCFCGRWAVVVGGARNPLSNLGEFHIRRSQGKAWYFYYFSASNKMWVCGCVFLCLPVFHWHALLFMSFLSSL